MLKELSRQIGFIVLVYICVCSSAEAQHGNLMLEKLEARVSAYEDAFRSNDYTRAASMISPNMINRIGGEENFARLVQKFTASTIMTLDPSLIEFNKPEEIVSYDNMYISVIRQIMLIPLKQVCIFALIVKKRQWLLFRLCSILRCRNLIPHKRISLNLFQRDMHSTDNSHHN